MVWQTAECSICLALEGLPSGYRWLSESESVIAALLAVVMILS